MAFVHLHTHSHYSLLQSPAKVNEILDRVKELGMDTIAVTEYASLYSAVEFTVMAKDRGMRAIIGCELFVSPVPIEDIATHNAEAHNLTLLATDTEGYKNLMRLITKAQLDGLIADKPRVDKKTLAEHAKGIIALSGCLDGEIPQKIIRNDLAGAKKSAEEYREIFGADNFFFELQSHPRVVEQERVNRALKTLSKELGIPLVATADIHTVREEDAPVQDLMICIKDNRKEYENDRRTMTDFDLWIKSEEEMRAAFPDTPEAIDNTAKIAERCHFKLTLGEISLPHYPLPEGRTPMEELRMLAEKGLAKRFPDGVPDGYRERLDYELSVIEKMGYPEYFLIVQDFINWARSDGIVVGPGRGSAAGSFVSYLTGITNIDPVKYSLLFERFLNPERVSMPDVDMDFADDRRDDVLRYCREKYGWDHVAHIITFGTMAARAAIRDVGRAMGLSYGFCDQVAKLIPMFSSIDGALQEAPDFKTLYNQNEDARRLIDNAKRLEGVCRHASVHACGVVITKDPVVEYTPVQRIAGDTDPHSICTQYSSSTKTSYVEKIGLLKMDFLGLKNLTIIQNTLRILKKVRDVDIDIETLPLDDEDTYKLLQRGETTGVFQLESSGMKRYLKLLKPTVFEDIVAMVALYRPGPMDWIPDFIAGKHGTKKVKYLNPKLEPILQNTYGVAVYQEQVMQIAQALAGFSLGEADILRKAMGKKILELIKEQREKFIAGCEKTGVGKKIGEQVFTFIEPFAGYGFNRCVTADTRLRRRRKRNLHETEKILKESNAYFWDAAFVYEEINIAHIKKGDEVASLEQKKGTFVWSKVHALLPNGIRPLLRITTLSQKTIRTTENHPYLTQKKETLQKKKQKNQKLYRFETDLSMKIENSNADTIIAIANNETSFTISLSKKVKQALWNKFRKNAPKKFAPTLYACLIVDAITQTEKQVHELVIDTDYLGHDATIARIIRNAYPSLEISFASVGKKSPAHFAAYGVHIKRKSADKAVSLDTLSTQMKNALPTSFPSHKRESSESHQAFFSKFSIENKEDFVKGGRWITASKLRIGQMIAVAHGNTPVWEKIVSIRELPQESVYDLEIDGTHNFIGNDIVAHNSHAACYALIGYQTAYLKAHYPAEFMAALLTSDQDNSDRVAIEVSECRDMGITVLPPNINESFEEFAVLKQEESTEYKVQSTEEIQNEKHTVQENPTSKSKIQNSSPLSDATLYSLPPTHSAIIRFGLNAIKNVGKPVAKAIVEERKRGGKYISIANLAERVRMRDLNKKSIESLAKVGAFDGVAERNEVLQNIESILNFIKLLSAQKNTEQVSLFDGTSVAAPTIHLKSVPAAKKDERLLWERQLLGLYVSDHPTRDYEEYLDRTTTRLDRLSSDMIQETITIGGIITGGKKIYLKDQKQMYFAMIENTRGKIECVVFPRTYEQTTTSWDNDRLVLVRGKLSDKDGQYKLLAESIKTLSPEEVITLKRIEATRKKYARKEEKSAECGVQNTEAQENQNSSSAREGMSSPRDGGIETPAAQKEESASQTHRVQEPAIPYVSQGNRILLAIPDGTAKETLHALSESLRALPAGNTPVSLLVNQKEVSTSFSVTATEEQELELRKILEKQN